MIDATISLALSRPELPVPPAALTACSGALQAVRSAMPLASSIAVTSALPSEGRSTIATGLAVAQAVTNGRRTVLLDLDVDESDTADGAGQEPHDSPLQFDVEADIDWVTSELGVVPQERLLAHGRPVARQFVEALVQQMGELGIAVVADLPPMPPNGGADRFVGLFDAVVLVVRAGSTDADLAQAAAGLFPSPPFVVLNRVRSAVPAWLRSGLGW